MELLKLLIVFIAVIGLVAFKVSLSLAVIIGAAITWVIFGIPLETGAVGIFRTVTAASTLQMVLIMYLITFMQRMMESRNAIINARDGLSSLFHSRWVNCAAAPIFIGLLPSLNAALIAGDMVESTASDYLDRTEMAVTTSYFRHISEAFLPTYQNILLALVLTGYTAGEFVLGMIPMIAVLIILGILFFLRGKVPNKIEGVESKDKKGDALKIAGLWPIFAAIVLIVAFNMNTAVASAVVIVVYFFVGKFSLKEIAPFFKSAFEARLIINIFAVYIFNEFLNMSGSISLLPDFFAQLPIPTFLIYVLIFLFGSLVAGSMTMTASVLPLAMASVPGAGLPLVCLLMITTYVAMQVAPIHICLVVVAEHFKVTLTDMIKKTLPLVGVFMVIAIAYYLGWTALIG